MEFDTEDQVLSKQEMEVSKQEMESFLPLPGLGSKTFYYKIFHIFSKENDIDLINRKWNYPNKKCNHQTHFQAFNQKHIFY